jgi:5-methylcytosine-specific restriction endonuclease McrA
MGKIMPLILDHINGISNDNRIENLRFLCSNCDSIQDTYKGRNRNISPQRKKIREDLNLVQGGS